MTYVLERFEDDLAVFSPDFEGRQLILPRADFAARKEGDVFVLNEAQVPVFDAALTKARKDAAKARFMRLVNRKPKTK